MTRPAPDLTHADPAEALIVYEQPLIERMRTFLRLGFLFQQAQEHAGAPTVWGTRAAVGSLLEIVAILARGDVRSDVLKELERHFGLLGQFESVHGVDDSRLRQLLDRIVNLRTQLGSAGQLTHRLNDCEFLSAIKHRSAIPGGTCEFDLPEYWHWLSRPHEHRKDDLDRWMAELQPLSEALEELLWLTRESAEPSSETANMGLFQQTLEKGTAYQLVRVAVPRELNAYPEISGSTHRFTVRFLTWKDVDNRPSQSPENVRFLLTRC